MKWILPLFIIVCLSSCSSAPLADLVIASGGVLYQDDFSDPASGWARISDGSGSMDYDNGRYQITVNNPDYDIWAVSKYTYEDTQVEVDAGRLEGPDENRYGLICRYSDPKNFYFFIITSDGYEAIGKVSGGVQTLLEQDMMTYSATITRGNGPNHLRFDCIGQDLAGYVNGQSIEKATDSDFEKGNAGLIAGTFDKTYVRVVFDNFIVYKP
jgi:hypothetical protein